MPQDNESLAPEKPGSYVSRVLEINRFSAAVDSLLINQATVGTTLSLRSSGTPSANDPFFNPLGMGSEALALVPSPVQLAAAKVDLNRLLASDVLDAGLTDATPGDEQTVSIAPDELSPASAGSWGQLNNVYSHFSGLADHGMISLATAMTTAVLVALTTLPLSLLSATPSPPVADKDGVGRYTLGRYLRSAQSNSVGAQIGLAIFGIQPTTYPLLRSATVGANAIFGNNVNGVPLVSANGPRAIADPGFNVVMARAIVRSARALAERVIDATKGNGLNVARSSIGLIDYIRSSKLIGAVNVFSRLGDTILAAQARDPQAFQGGAAALNTSLIKGHKSTPMDAVSGDRLDGSLKRAWAGNVTPTSLLIPENLVADALAGNVPLPGVRDPASKTTVTTLMQANQVTQGARLSTSDVAALESKLDGEYVPFYFHDLRTNEIVSFHAFITALTDDFSVEWENVDGYGRVEPVKIYKGTQRRISLGFYAVSTGPEDFNEMWIKLNKLLTMVYPQFTQGKLVQSDNQATYRFVQPFSQLMGASPLIRLRLGDLLRSNYSKFALMRLFGYGDKEVQLNSVAATYGAAIDPERVRMELSSAIARGDASLTFYAAPGRYNAERGITAPPGDPNNADVFDTLTLKLASSFVVTVSQPTLDGQSVVCTVKTNPDSTLVNGYDSSHNGIGAAPINTYEGGRYRIPLSALRPTRATLMRIIQRLAPGAGSTDQQFLTEATSFFDDATNAVVKSFKAVGGKGLAGVIDTVSFDWYDRIPWETELDARAPQMCRVTMGFSPIHDITPGLDHNGYSRAPVFPVSLKNRGA